jgi:hypothetical protein
MAYSGEHFTKVEVEAFYDEELPNNERRALSRHMLGCEECMQLVMDAVEGGPVDDTTVLDNKDSPPLP